MKRNLLIAGLTALALIAPVSGVAEAQPPSRFSVTVSGKGPDVILVPGLVSSGDVWNATVQQLAPTHRVHVVQVAGFAGAAPGANGEEGALKALVEELVTYAAGLGHPAIIGHSLGGLAALEVAARKPDAVGRVLVVDALPFYPLIMSSKATVEMVKPQAAMMRNQIAAQSDAQSAAGAAKTAARLSKTEAGQALVMKWSIASDRKVAAQMMYEDMIDDARGALASITAKLTIVYAYDAVMGAQAEVDELYRSAYSAAPSAKLARIDNSYHFIMLDQPAAFAEEVAAFLKECGAALGRR
jgi:pimeloyl-ACP methyl ester carboxylesterase